jgi:hypothetical protein
MAGGPPPLPLIAYPGWLKPPSGSAAAFAGGGASGPASPIPEKGAFRQLIDFLFGDVASIWTGGAEGFPYGKWAAGLIRVIRGTGFVIGTLRGLAPAVPLFNNGFVGRMLIKGLDALGATRLASGLAGPVASLWLQRIGIVGGVVGGGIGVYKLIEQGNPIDAYERRGAGYVADVASTAFSFSSAAFFYAPNPYTGAAMVVTGAVWLGAEAWDEYGDEISDAVSSAVDSTGDFLSSSAETIGGALDTAGDWVASELDDLGSGIEDAGAAVVGALGSIF